MRSDLAAINFTNELEGATFQVARLHVDVSQVSRQTTASDEALIAIGSVLTRSVRFLHRREMRHSIIRLLLAFDWWEDESQPHREATIHISPHKPDQG